MTMTNDTQIKTLNGLIETTLDSARAYQEASGHAANPSFKRLFEQRSTHREQLAGALQSEVRGLGGKPVDSGTVLAVAERIFIGLKNFAVGDDQSVVSQAMASDIHIKGQFETALRSGLVAPTDGAAARVYASILADHDQMQDLLRTVQAPESVVVPGPKAKTFAEPNAVLADPSLDDTRKRAILEQWRDDAMQLSEATSEGMGGGEDSKLRRVNDALLELERRTGVEAEHKQRNVTA